MSEAARVVIVSPALAQANNGNWQTAFRWRRLLSSRHRVRIAAHWPDDAARTPDGRWQDDVMLALHARRMAEPVAQWAALRGTQGLGVVLTGTDLYRDIQTDASAQRSLDLAQRLVVLQELGLDELAPRWRQKTDVVVQSVTSRQTLTKTRQHLTAVMVGHLRPEKSPETLMQAAALLAPHAGIRLVHIGRGLDDGLAVLARQTAQAHAHYRWLGEQSHSDTRRHIQRAHVLIHASCMEGGAHVVMEAVCSGTPVLASRIPGNLGLLGADYTGTFAVGDAQALADALLRLRQDQLSPTGRGLDALAAQCEARRHLFAPQAEQRALLNLVDRLRQLA